MTRPLPVDAAVAGTDGATVPTDRLRTEVGRVPYADIDGRLLVLTDTGGDGPPVVFCHGVAAGARAGAYDQQIAALSDVYRVIDWRDRDDVQQADATDAWAPARILFGLLDALGIERAVLCGAADAALLVIRAALLHPDRVRGLALLHGHLPVPDRDRPGPRPHPGALPDADHLAGRVEELAMPVLLVHGDADAAHPLGDAHAVAEVVSDPRGVVEVAGAASDLAVAHPAVVTAAMRDYLEGLPA